MSRKVLIIGLDGVSFDVIGPWIKEGRLPVLKSLMENGTSGSLRTVFPPITPAAWTSFMTGKNPGKHGIYDFLYRKDDSYDMAPCNGNMRDGRTIWDIMATHGMKVGLMNIPMTYPPVPLNGFMLTGLETPRFKPIHKTNYTYPEELRDEIYNNVGDYVIHPKGIYRGGNVEEIIEELTDVLDMRLKVAKYLMEKKEWDFMMMVFGETDKVQHDLMHFIDPDHRQYSDRFRDPIINFFKRVDDAIGDILEKVSDKDTVIIMSDHGNGPIYKWIYLNNWLIEKGYLTLKMDAISLLKRFFFSIGITPSNIYQVLTKFGFSKASIGQGARYNILTRFFLSTHNIDWARTKAYSAGHVGQIFINLKGREPLGCVEPGEEYEEVRLQIKNDLLNIVDPETGEKVVEEVYFREEIYRGKYFEQAADILFMPSKLEYWSLGVSSFISNRIIGPAFGNTGNHRMDGIFIMKDENVKKGDNVSGAKIYDIAPTILYGLGLPVPEDMDGRILTDIFDNDFVRRHKIVYESGSSDKERRSSDFSEGEEESVRESLRGLGYLG